MKCNLCGQNIEVPNFKDGGIIPPCSCRIIDGSILLTKTKRRFDDIPRMEIKPQKLTRFSRFMLWLEEKMG